MSIAYKMDHEPEHEGLSISFNTLVALSLQKSLIAEGIDKEKARFLAENLTFDIAMVFDNEFIQVNGEKFLPRVSFVNENGEMVPGAADFDFLHEYAATPLDDLDDLEIIE
ncbi:hypothetical protein [Profundibacter sp.]